MREILPFMAGFGLLITAVVIWSGVWKAIALWKAARNSDLGWFIALCLINTLGILEILYIYIFAKHNCSGSCCEHKTTTPPTPPQA